MFMITPLPCVPLKPGSGTRGFPGVEVDVVNEEGQSVPANEEGYLVIKTPWPAMLRTIAARELSANAMVTPPRWMACR